MRPRDASSWSRFGALAVGLACLVGCQVGASHPDRCQPDGSCPQGRSCYVGYCVVNEEVVADSGVTPPRVEVDAGLSAEPPDASTPVLDAAPPVVEPPVVQPPVVEPPVVEPPVVPPTAVTTCTESDCEPSCAASSCTFDCASSSNCSPSCAAGSTCDVQCANASNCELECRGTCTMACGQASNCRADCRGGSCDVTCPSEGNCDEVRCRPGTACLLRCQQAGKCRFMECPGGETACSATLKACNRACP